MNCFMCKGDLEDKLTNFTVDLGNTVIIIKSVPSHVCSQCGEVSYSDEVAEKIEKIIDEVKNNSMEVAIYQYPAA